MIKLVGQYNNTYHHSINKKLFCFYWKTEVNSKAPKFKVNGRVRRTKYKNIFSKDYTENWPRKIFIIDSVLKINPCTYKIKDLNGEK